MSEDVAHIMLHYAEGLSIMLSGVRYSLLDTNEAEKLGYVDRGLARQIVLRTEKYRLLSSDSDMEWAKSVAINDDCFWRNRFTSSLQKIRSTRKGTTWYNDSKLHRENGPALICV
jgi:hypothetical protein